MPSVDGRQPASLLSLVILTRTTIFEHALYLSNPIRLYPLDISTVHLIALVSK
jgi:hypothetical protein